MPQDEPSVRRAYDEVADAYADAFTATEGEQPLDLAMIRHFADALTTRSPAPRVLDAGCGAGRMLPLLAGFGCRAEGVDLSPEMIRRARADHPGFATRVGSITDLPFPDAGFDGVFSWYSTIHGDDAALALALREFRRVLRPGGLALVAFQAGAGVHDVAPAYRAHGHEIVLARWRRTPDEVAAALRAAGLAERARLDRAPVGPERDHQAVLVAAAGEDDRARP